MRLARHAGLAAAISLLTACNTVDRLEQIGATPPMSPVMDPTMSPDYQPVQVAMPAQEQVAYQPNSLWRPGARTFFKDQRAARVGDILTINIEIDDEAKVANT